MNDVTQPPSLGAQLEHLWKAFQSAAGAFSARIEELRAEEQAIAPCEDYQAIMRSANLPDFDAMLLKVARYMRESLIANASKRFAPDGASLEINSHEIEEHFPLTHDTGTAAFKPTVDWDFLVTRYAGDGGQKIAWQQAAEALSRSFGLNREAEVKTKSGRVILELSIYSEKHFRGYWEISYQSGESVSKAFSTLLAFARWAHFEELADKCQSEARRWTGYKSELTSRTKYPLGEGCDYVTFLRCFELRLAPRVAEQLQIFIATFGGHTE